MQRRRTESRRPVGTRRLYLSWGLLLVACCVPSDGTPTANTDHDRLLALALVDRKAFAEEVVAGAASDYERAQALVTWFAENFDWTATDYERRSVQQILERGGGNCAELARVTTEMLQELGLQMRRIREINVHVESQRRQQTARDKVEQSGYRMSVFGKRHNDHVWIEIRDRDSGEWFPADPSLGVVGKQQWLAARMGFGERFTLDPTSADMIVPFAVFAQDDEGNFVENRSAYYVIDGFDELYGGRLRGLPAWADWVHLIDILDDEALAAFRGEANLHDHEAEIDALAATYDRLRDQYSATEKAP